MGDDRAVSVEMDSDVQSVAAFMQAQIAASRLVAVAEGLAAIAPALWGRYVPEPVQALRLSVVAPSAADGQQTRSSANG
jgi:uncharacterized protein YjeT (DUF2065 family)